MASLDGLVGKAYTLYAIDFPGTALTEINQITSQSIDNGLQRQFFAGGSALHNEMVATFKVAPTVSFSTTQVASVLNLLNGASTYLTLSRPITSSDSAVLYFQQRDNKAGLKAGTSHIKITITSGLMVVNNITASSDGAATIDVQIYLVSDDGSSAPFAVADSQSLPAKTYTEEVFTVGPMAISTVDFGDIQSVTINPGLTVNTRVGGGSLYPTFVSIDAVEPVVSVGILDISALTTSTLAGAPLPGTASIWLRKKAADGAGNIANGTSSHIQFDIYNGTYSVENPSSQHRGDATATLMIHPVVDGALTQFLDIDTTAAIS